MTYILVFIRSGEKKNIYFRKETVDFTIIILHTQHLGLWVKPKANFFVTYI